MQSNVVSSHHEDQIAATMQAVTLVLVTPVPQGAHWLIRKQVRLADQARYHHALTVSSLGSDCQACTAPLQTVEVDSKILVFMMDGESLTSCTRGVHTHIAPKMGRT